jgi:hypothetical protein
MSKGQQRHFLEKDLNASDDIPLRKGGFKWETANWCVYHVEVVVARKPLCSTLKNRVNETLAIRRHYTEPLVVFPGKLCKSAKETQKREEAITF